MAGHAGADPYARSKSWGILATTWLIAFFVTAYQILPAGFLSIIMEDMSIGPAAAGWLVSASVAAQAAGNVPVGIAIDRTTNRLIIALAAIAMAISGIWAWQAGGAGNYWSLVVAIALGGLAIAAVITAGANLIGSVFAGESDATAVALFMTAPPAGFAVGQFTGPVVAGRYGWSTNFLIFGVSAFAAFVLFWIVGRGLTVNPGPSDPPKVADFGRLFTNRAVWVVTGMGFAAYSVYFLLNTWLPSYLAQTFGLALATSGLFAAVFPAIGILARATGGAISDHVFDRQRRPVALIAFVVSLPIVAGMGLLGAPLLIAIALVPAGFFIQLGIGLFYTYVREVVDPGVTGTALALLGLVSFIGAFTAPAVAGLLIEATGTFLPAFAYAGLLAFIGIGLAIVAPEPNPTTSPAESGSP